MDTANANAKAPATSTRDAVDRVRIVDHLRAKAFFAFVAACDETEGEITEEVEDLETQLAELSEEQLEALGEAVLFLQGFEAQIDARKKELDAQKARYKALREKLTGRIGAIIGGGKPPKLATVKISVRTSHSWKDLETAPELKELPGQFRERVVTWKRDANALKKAVRAGLADGATKNERALAEKLSKFGYVAEKKSVSVKGC